MLILAHRGASADAPENTLPAFREAAAQGADGVELDVMLCGSGELVVCHDERLDRLAGLDLDVRTTPLWKLRRADVGAHLGFTSATIPTLEEVVAVLPPEMLINIEIKCETVDDGGLSARVGEYVRRAGLVDRVIISSFNALCLLRLATGHPELRRGFLIDPDGSFLLQDAVGTPLAASYSVHPHFSACTPARMARWAEAGLQVAVWTVDDPAEARRVRDLGAAYCITNRPRSLRQNL
jgi:glycerophosphoryl diester phosphodiesterase